ncbi:MAG: hypothetical protein RR697_03605 [Malacoplasma sp.]
MWKNIEINIQNIVYNTGKATLINMPRKSNYDGYSFWHSSKLIRNGKNSYSNSLGYTEEFIFKLKKYGKGKYNSRDVIYEIEISVEEFEEAFECMSECTREKENEDSYLKIEEPEKIDNEVEIEEELTNDYSECTKYLAEGRWL